MDLATQRSEHPLIGLSPLFRPVDLAGLGLRNPLAVAPMTRISAEPDGRPTSRMGTYYAAFAQGGFGLVLTEGIYTDKAFSQGYLFQPGLTDSDQEQAWRPIVADVHSRGARFFAQLMHAGALSQGNPHRTGTRGPSAVRPLGAQLEFYRGRGPYPVPAAMNRDEIREAVEGFAEAAARARAAGFDGVEIHGANGYLLDQFLTHGINRRRDDYGGAGRLRLIEEVVRAVRRSVGTDFVVGIRISQAKVNDFVHKWRGADEAATIFSALGQLPLDYVHTTEFEAWQPAFAQGPSLAALAKRHSALPVIANGSLHDPDRAAAMLSAGEADLVSLGRGALQHPDWPARASAGLPLEPFDRGMLSPLADLETAERHRQRLTSAAPG